MMNTMTIERPVISNHRIEYRYRVEGEWTEAFRMDAPFFIDYSCDISSIPDGVAMVPLLCNILPMAWVYDAKVIVPVCDQDFYESIPAFKQGYIDMYPMMSLDGTIEIRELQCFLPSKNSGSMAFFSGGVDAFNTLINHRDEKPTLLTLWGSDVSLDDQAGWTKVKAHLDKTSELFGTGNVVIKSCFRRFLNESVLSRKVRQSGDGWWHGFQHGIGLIGHAAPAVFSLGKGTVYIASSFTAADRGKVTCASDPTIDNFVRFCGANVVHDGYEYTRQDKIHIITQFSSKSGKRIPLRVCWESKGGSNCCDCEKCWRTMLGVYAEGFDPGEYGFDYNNEQLSRLSKKMRISSDRLISELRYKPIQTAMRINTCKTDLPKEIRWFYNIDVKRLGKPPLWLKEYRRLKAAMKRVMRCVTYAVQHKKG